MQDDPNLQGPQGTDDKPSPGHFDAFSFATSGSYKLTRETINYEESDTVEATGRVVYAERQPEDEAVEALRAWASTRTLEQALEGAEFEASDPVAETRVVSAAPAFGQVILSLVCGPEQLEARLGCLAETFDEDVSSGHRGRALRNFSWNVSVMFVLGLVARFSAWVEGRWSSPRG